MGYSGRYHAASLAAVFIALAIGILIGIGLGDNVVSTASQELEDSLRSDLDDSEALAEDLERDLGREREFGSRIYPAVVSGRLAGSSVAVVGVGSLSDDLVADIEEAVEPAGAKLAARAVLAVPVDPTGLAESAPPRFNSARRGGEGLEAFGRAIGSGIVGGSTLIEQTRGTVFSRFSGALADVDYVVFTGYTGDELEPEQQEDLDTLLNGVIDGVRRNASGVAAVERTDTSPTTLAPFSAAGIATVDHADLVAGQVALVFSLLGAGGDYGTKAGTDRFLPELINPAPTGGSAGSP